MVSPKLSADEGTVAFLISLAGRARCSPATPTPPPAGARGLEKAFFFFPLFSVVFFLVWVFFFRSWVLSTCVHRRQVAVLASNWAVVDMLMRRLGCG